MILSVALLIPLLEQVHGVYKKWPKCKNLRYAESEDLLQLFNQLIFELNLTAFLFLQNCFMLLVVLQIKL